MMKRKQSKRFTAIFSQGVEILLSIGLSMVLQWLMLPYQIYRLFVPKAKPGRPGGHPLSKMFQNVFESKKSKRFIGAGLAVVIMFFGVMESILAAGSVAKDETLMSPPVVEMETENTLEKPVNGVLAQGFHGFHRAIDILAPIGTEIRPITRGRIIEVSFGRIGWGNTVVVEHEKGLKSRYAHMGEIRVIEGETVEKGQVLGDIGMTGWTTGPHLHLEIYQGYRAIDPEDVLPEFSSPSWMMAQK